MDIQPQSSEARFHAFHNNTPYKQLNKRTQQYYIHLRSEAHTSAVDALRHLPSPTTQSYTHSQEFINQLLVLLACPVTDPSINAFCQFVTQAVQQCLILPVLFYNISFLSRKANSLHLISLTYMFLKNCFPFLRNLSPQIVLVRFLHLLLQYQACHPFFTIFLDRGFRFFF